MSTTPGEIERRAAEMAAAVDARLSGQSLLMQSIAATEERATDGVVATVPSRGRGLTEEEVFEFLKDVGETDHSERRVGYRWGMRASDVGRWVRPFLKDFHKAGWPRLLSALESRGGGPGINFETHTTWRTTLYTPRWLREWRCLWFLMRFYDDPHVCEQEWRGVFLSRPTPLEKAE